LMHTKQEHSYVSVEPIIADARVRLTAAMNARFRAICTDKIWF
jgi:hypothetical protein